MSFLTIKSPYADSDYVINVSITSGNVQIICTPTNGESSFDLYSTAITGDQVDIFELPECELEPILTGTATIDIVPKRTR